MRKRASENKEHRATATEGEQQAAAEAAARHHLRTVTGRRIVRPVLDHDGSLILGTGETITHRVVERARRAGVLDKLLNAVSWEEPQIDGEEALAPEPGEAPLAHRTGRKEQS